MKKQGKLFRGLVAGMVTILGIAATCQSETAPRFRSR